MSARKLLWMTAGMVRPCSRRLSSYQERLTTEEAHAGQVKETWKKISLFICLPTISYFTWKHVIVGGKEEHEHKYVPWSHLRIRTKPFPWKDGDVSLFHNPHTNPRPDGEPAKVVSPSPTFTQKVGYLWIKHLHEDPVKRDEERWQHLEALQRRKEEHLARKRIPDVPIRPMDLTTEVKVQHRPNPAHNGFDN